MRPYLPTILLLVSIGLAISLGLSACQMRAPKFSGLPLAKQDQPMALNATVGVYLHTEGQSGPLSLGTWVNDGIYTHNHFSSLPGGGNRSQFDELYLFDGRNGVLIVSVPHAAVTITSPGSSNSETFYQLPASALAELRAANLRPIETLTAIAVNRSMSGQFVTLVRWQAGVTPEFDDERWVAGELVLTARVEAISAQVVGVQAPYYLAVQAETTAGDSGGGLWFAGQFIGNLRSETASGAARYDIHQP